jgi:hypothetical protein
VAACSIKLQIKLFVGCMRVAWHAAENQTLMAVHVCVLLAWNRL